MTQAPTVLLDAPAPTARMIVPFLAIPTASGGPASYDQVRAIESFRASFQLYGRGVATSSLLAYGFNRLYADALNDRAGDGKPGATHFIMLHDDVVPYDPPDVGWAQALVVEMIQNNLGALCAAVAIKDGTGDSSTAIDNDRNDPAPARRIRLEEFKDRKLITTREEPRLLINTGCLCIDLTKPWAERLYFHVKDGIRKNAEGNFEPWVDPEDYNFSRMLRREGVHFGCTAAFETVHVGRRKYSSRG